MQLRKGRLMTDMALWDRWVRRRDAEAFEQIIRRHADMVYATCCRVLRNAADAEDITQECFQKLAETRRGPARHLPAWLHRVATNLALNRIKAKQRRRDREARFVREYEGQAAVDWDDVYDLVDEAMLELPDSLRDLIVAHFYERRSHNEIAETIGVSRQTVTYRISKGIEQLRQSLRRRGVPIAAAALTAGLAADTAAAAPAMLAERLARIALAGLPDRAGILGFCAASTGLSALAPYIAGGTAVLAILAAVFFSMDFGSNDNAPGASESIFRAPPRPADVARDEPTTTSAGEGATDAVSTDPRMIPRRVTLPNGVGTDVAGSDPGNEVDREQLVTEILGVLRETFEAASIVAAATPPPVVPTPAEQGEQKFQVVQVGSPEWRRVLVERGEDPDSEKYRLARASYNQRAAAAPVIPIDESALEEANKLLGRHLMPAEQLVELADVGSVSDELPMDLYGDNEAAMAVSALVAVQGPPGTGFLVFTLARTPGETWRIQDVDLEDQDGSLGEIDRFLHVHPSASPLNF